MKTQMIVTMKNEDKVKIKIQFTGKGFDDHEQIEAEAAKYSSALDLGFKYQNCEYVAESEATPEACTKFVEFAEKYGLEIIQL